MYIDIEKIASLYKEVQAQEESQEESLREKFNALIGYSAIYVKGEKVIPLENIKNLKLGNMKKFQLRHKEVVIYETALNRFKKKVMG